jgi:hypothetical protein
LVFPYFCILINDGPDTALNRVIQQELIYKQLNEVKNLAASLVNQALVYYLQENFRKASKLANASYPSRGRRGTQH